MQNDSLAGDLVPVPLAPGRVSAADVVLAPGEGDWAAALVAAGWPADRPAVLVASGAAPASDDPGPVPLPVAGGTRAGGPAIVAVIDDAVAFLHRRFRQAGGRRTRFDGVWLMPGRGAGGAVLDRGAIDAMIAGGCEASAYARLSARLFAADVPRGLTRAATHGTHVADLAAGAAPGAMDGVDLLAACLPPLALRDTTGGDWAADLVRALHWVVLRAAALSAVCRAGPRPLVVNLSLGTSAGPKDGTGPVERALVEALAVYEALTDAPARATLAFGNDYRTRQVARLHAGAADPATIGWQVPPDDRLGARMLVRAPGRVALAVVPPGAAAGGSVDVAPGGVVPILHRGHPVGEIRALPAGSGGLLGYEIALAPTRRDAVGAVAPAGRWTVALTSPGTKGTQTVTLQVHRGDTPPGQRLFGRQSYLVHPACAGFDTVTRDWSHPGGGPVTREGTHSALIPVGDRRVFAVAAAGARPERAGLAPVPARYSAAGSTDPMLTCRTGPDLAAPAEASPTRPGVVAAGTRSGSALRQAGTSVAAPALARRLALELGPGGALAGGRRADEIGVLLSRPGAVAAVSDPSRQGRGWVPSDGARRG